MREKKNFVATILAVLLIIIFYSTAVRADQTDKLIKILIKKGIITSEEAKSLENEVRGETTEKEVKKEASTAEDWTKKIEVGYKKGAYIKTPDSQRWQSGARSELRMADRVHRTRLRDRKAGRCDAVPRDACELPRLRCG